MAKTFDITLKHIEDEFGPDWATVVIRRIGLPIGTFTAPIDSDLSVTSSQADKLFQLSGAVEGILHLEFEASWAGDAPPRLNFYSALAEIRHGGPVYSVLILLRPEADSPILTGRYVRTRPDGDYGWFKYEVVRVWTLPAAELLAGPIGVLPLALLTDEARPKLPELVRAMDERVTQELGATPQAELLRTACYLLLGLRYDGDWINRLFSGVTGMRESTTYQGILREGEARGEAKGLIGGRQDSILRIGHRRFGAPTQLLESTIRSITDQDRLNRMIDELVTVGSWDDLLRT